ncbi:MAG: LA2681 family HEPN domain-containing protein [Terriglobia bacterium]
MNNRTPGPCHPVLPVAAKPVVLKIRDLISTGRAEEALPCVAELDEFGHDYATSVKLTKWVLLIDIASDLDDSDSAARGISLLKDVDVALLPESAASKHWYNLGNGYGALYNIKKVPSGLRRALDEDFSRAKQCYRKAMSLGASSPHSTACLYTNYGILLRTVGRHVEEIEAYDEALKAVPNFAMALWHKAKGLGWYSRLVERPTKRSALLEAWHLLKTSLEAGLEPTHEAKARKELAELERILKEPKVPAHKHTKHIAHSDVEATYIRFCVENRLYLHPCPVHAHEAYQDPLSVRFPTSVKGEFFELRSDRLALIKQEHIAARFLLFCYRSKQPDLSFVDRGTYLPAVQQGNGQIYLQLLILSFRAAYSILDKIAFFLNKKCRMGQEENRVYFREGLFVADAVLRPELAQYDGPQLAVLFDLAREFSKDQPLYPLRDLRRKLEHRCVTVRRAENSIKENGSSASVDGRTYDIPTAGLTDNDLYESTLRLLRAVRAAIFYLFYFVRKSDEPPRAELR